MQFPKLVKKVDGSVELGYKPLDRLPVASLNNSISTFELRRANRYINYQENRILEAYFNGQLDKVVGLWCRLLKNSLNYQFAIFIKANRKYYYSMNQYIGKEQFTKFVNRMHEGDLKLFLKRFYITKPNGKLRPIGCPKYESRALSRSINGLNYLILVYGKEGNHAYTKGRCGGTAVEKVLKGILAGYRLYEFDLKSFFNTISGPELMGKLNQINEKLMNVNMSLIMNTNYSYEKLEEESELKHLVTFENKVKGKYSHTHHIGRQGLPQGLNMSPLLAVIGLNLRPLDNLIMYADDGVYLYRNDDDLYKFFMGVNSQYDYGISISREKSGRVGKELEFLGFTIDIEKKTVRYKDSERSFNLTEDTLEGKELVDGLGKCGSKYSKTPKKGEGKTKEKCFLAEVNIEPELSGSERIYVRMASMVNLSYKQYRYVNGVGYVDCVGASTLVASKVINEIKSLLVYKKKKKLNLDLQKWVSYRPPVKEIYMERGRIGDFGGQ